MDRVWGGRDGMGMRDGEVKEKKIYSIKCFLFDSPHLLIHPKQVEETFNLSTYQSFRASNDSFRHFLCLPTYLSIYLSIYPSMNLFVYLSMNLFITSVWHFTCFYLVRGGAFPLLMIVIALRFRMKIRLAGMKKKNGLDWEHYEVWFLTFSRDSEAR